MNAREHWQRVYETRASTEVSWYSPRLEQSLALIREVASPDARIIDVGAGASTLVDDLLDLGFRNLTALDLSDAALAIAQRRLGARSSQVTWLAADVTTASLAQNGYDVWHDRAVFHFLTREGDREAYVRQLHRSLVAGGYAVVATFALQGPQRCSGLDVVRYDAASLARELGARFALDVQREATHTTPAGTEQRFLFCRFRKLG